MEEWKDIDGSPGYQVSNTGKVRSFVNNRHGVGTRSRELKPYVNRLGYMSVHLGRGCIRSIHRLVASAYIPNPNGYPLVRHLDDDPTNNNAHNLAWGTQTDNMGDCVAHGRLVGNTMPAINATKKSVIAIRKHDGLSMEFSSIHDAARELGVWSQHICNVLRGKIRQTGGWLFEYSNGGVADGSH